jgi:hypothetical protein
MVLELFVLAMGLALGYLVASELAKDWYLAQVSELELELAKAQQLLKEKEKAQVLQSVKVEMSAENLEKARQLGWGWVLGLEPKQE